MLQLLQDQSTGPFSNNEAIAVLIEWARSKLWCFVPGRGCKQCVEHSRFRRAEFFRTATDHNRLAALAYRFKTVANALAGRGTGTGSSIYPALHAKEHRDIHRGGMAHHANITGGIEALGRAVQKHIAEISGSCRAAGGRTIGYPNPAAGEHRIAEQARLL